MIFQDDRTPEQKKTHTLIVLATDRFMSGWGMADAGASYAGWACTPELVDTVERRIRARGDMSHVRIVGNDYRPRGAKHVHIYVAKD